jgi:hypothetical protein
VTTVSYECARGLRVVALLRERLPEVLTALIAAGEGDTAGRLASLLGTHERDQVGDQVTVDRLRASGIHAGLGRTAAELRGRIRAELERRGIRADTPEAFADAVARLAGEGDG